MTTDLATSDIVSFSQLKPGDKIKFFVLDTKNVILGTVKAIASYDIAKAMQTDIASRHASMQAAATQLESTDSRVNIGLLNIIDDNFIILDVGETRPTVVAKSWIYGDIHRIDRCDDYTIVLRNCTKATAIKALNKLRADGIACSFENLN